VSLLKPRATQTPTEQVWLPPFRRQVDHARKWLGHVDKMKEEFSWSDMRTLVFVGGFLFNNSKRLFENWSPMVRNWANFENDLFGSLSGEAQFGSTFGQRCKL